ncbi:MAG: hypothetical protein AAGC58_06030 [Asticcacaulis sp.]
METLVRLYAALEKEESDARRRIRRLSVPFEVAFTFIGTGILFVVVLILLLAFAPVSAIASIWVGPGNAYIVPAFEAPPLGASAFSDLPILTIATAGLAFFLISGPLVIACYYLKRLFAHYRLGDVFGKDPQVAMQNAAVALIAFALPPGLLQPVLRLAGSPDRQWFNSHSLATLMVGTVLLVLARVLVLGREVEDEAKGFI